MTVQAIGVIHDGDPDSSGGSLASLPPVKVGAKYNSAAPTYTSGDVTTLQADVNGNLKTTSSGGTVTPVSPSGTPTSTTPTMLTATSVTIAAANASRKYLLVQNNSAANIMVSLSAAVLTGIAPTSTNIGIVLVPGQSYETPSSYITLAAITAYQTSGGTINTVTVVEG
jgi:hypothetical protein